MTDSEQFAAIMSFKISEMDFVEKKRRKTKLGERERETRWRKNYGTEILKILFVERFPQVLFSTLMKCYLGSDPRNLFRMISSICV